MRIYLYLKNKEGKQMGAKEHNHLYPVFHIKKWIENGGRIFDKEKAKERFINYQKDFSFRYYYSLGEHNSELEERLCKFEHYIAPIIKNIDDANDSISLTAKELEILKLYCVLCGSRHNFTSEVIKDDESGIYQSNNYLLGLYRATTQKEAIRVTTQILDDFEKIEGMSNDMETQINPWVVLPGLVYSVFNIGLHIAIVRSEKPLICISDRFCIIENTLDSDFLYSYVPISPQTALFLVKSKYYLDDESFIQTKTRFGINYGSGEADPYLSVILGRYKNFDCEDILFCSYYRFLSHGNIKETYLTQFKAKKVKIKVNILSDEIFKQYNSIFCEDGKLILFCDKEELKFAIEHPLKCREIACG